MRVLTRDSGKIRILLLALLPIGDILFTLPTILALRKRYPSAYIAIVVHSLVAPVVQCIPEVNDVYVLPAGMDWRGFRVLFQVLYVLRKERFHIAIDFTSPVYKWISFFCAIPLRTYMKFDRFWWFFPRNHAQWKGTHAAKHYYDCAKELMLPNLIDGRMQWDLSLPQKHYTHAAEWVKANANIDKAPRIIMHVGGAYLHGVKRWPVSHFAQLADILIEKYHASIVFVGGPEDGLLVEQVKKSMKHEAVSATGQFSLLTTFALIQSSNLFIGNDSGILHAAAILGVPFVGIYGPTNPRNFHPLPKRAGQGYVVVPSQCCHSPQYFVGGNVVWAKPCCQGTCKVLQTVSVAQVLHACDILLQSYL